MLSGVFMTSYYKYGTLVWVILMAIIVTISLFLAVNYAGTRYYKAPAICTQNGKTYEAEARGFITADEPPEIDKYLIRDDNGISVRIDGSNSREWNCELR